MDFILMLVSLVSLFTLNVDTSQHFPEPLKKSDEISLFKKYNIDNDTEARNTIIEHNLRLVAHIVRKYYSSCEDAEDLISVGTIGLIKAVDTFNVEKGARFGTYAAKCIQNEILMLFRSKKKCSQEVSINGTIDTDRDGNPLTYMDIIRCEDTIADDLDIKLKISDMCKYINRLEKRERKIIILRYGLNGYKPLTQRETAIKLGISRSYVSRIEKSVLEKISKQLEE